MNREDIIRMAREADPDRDDLLAACRQAIHKATKEQP